MPELEESLEEPEMPVLPVLMVNQEIPDFWESREPEDSTEETEKMVLQDVLVPEETEVLTD